MGKGLSEQKAPIAAMLHGAAIHHPQRSADRRPGLCSCAASRAKPDATTPSGAWSRRQACAPRWPSSTAPATASASATGAGRRTHHGARRAVATAAGRTSACNAVTGALEVSAGSPKGSSSSGVASGARPADAGGQPHPELPGIDAHHSGPLRDRRRSPADARRGPRTRQSSEIAAIAMTVNGMKDPASGKPWRVEVEQGPVHVSVAGDRVIGGRRLRSCEASQAALACGAGDVLPDQRVRSGLSATTSASRPAPTARVRKNTPTPISTWLRSSARATRPRSMPP